MYLFLQITGKKCHVFVITTTENCLDMPPQLLKVQHNGLSFLSHETKVGWVDGWMDE